MNYDEITRAIKSAITVYGYVQFTTDDGVFVRLTKKQATEQVKRLKAIYGTQQEFIAYWYDTNCLYIG